VNDVDAGGFAGENNAPAHLTHSERPPMPSTATSAPAKSGPTRHKEITLLVRSLTGTR